ncbi:hypothetical protein MUG87_03005 [Ectobacillus sp. JY-23]|uniref:hypothetical protein n=1 Tax=Ectobacillus sp. JY-23 TaxID=2933872 RepID=UPI001FF4B1C5|nr:hypothetical protein [Ectobacillus sp. JY-23]UOY93120.1 hypothetical protein MUG87_03005 [Ectobacillus sp. JY-23]
MLKRKRNVISLVVSVLLFGWCAVATAATVPSVSYVKTGERSLIFVNNPEQIYTEDLGDSTLGDKSIYRDTLVPGKYRNFFEHVNRTGLTIGFGIQLYNPNSYAVNVTVYGAGYEASVYGGRPFAQMFSNYSSLGTAYSIPAGGSYWVMRKDNSVPNGSFFSGVIDFDISGGQVIINNIAYRSFSALDGSTSYMGYVQRIETDGTHEARVYKGMSPYSEVVASNVNFTISNTDVKGILAVQHPNYNLVSGTFGNTVIRTDGWVSNIGPSFNSNAITSDMLSFNMPGWGAVSCLAQSDGEGKYGNLGNWGVVYTIKGTVTNTGSTTRHLSVNYKGNSSANAFIAYRGSDGVWRSTQVTPGSNIQYYTFSVLGNTSVSYEAKFVIGGPSAGNIVQSISLNN